MNRFSCIKSRTFVRVLYELNIRLTTVFIFLCSFIFIFFYKNIDVPHKYTYLYRYRYIYIFFPSLDSSLMYCPYEMTYVLTRKFVVSFVDELVHIYIYTEETRLFQVLLLDYISMCIYIVTINYSFFSKFR